MYSNCVEFPVYNTKSELTVLCGCADNWHLPLGLSQFDDFCSSILGLSIFFKSWALYPPQYGTELVYRMSGRSKFNSILGCPNPSLVAVSHGFEFERYFNEVGTILTVIIRYVHLSLPMNDGHVFGVLQLFVSLHLGLL